MFIFVVSKIFQQQLVKQKVQEQIMLFPNMKVSLNIDAKNPQLAVDSLKLTYQSINHSKSSNNLSLRCQDVDSQVIGKYTYYKNRLLGVGSYGRVHFCHLNQDINKEYAMKIITLSKMKKNQLILLNNEIAILKKLDHPNILKLIDFYKTDKTYYIITELCQKDDLATKLLKSNRFQEIQALHIIKDILNGYKYLIQNNIVHRDIKPANILRGQQGLWKISDFGYAEKSDSNCKLITKINVGSPLYMPLQTLQKNIYSVKSDIFSIGIVMYELITGHTPWEASCQEQLIKNMKNQPIQFPVNVQVTKEVSILICKCLQIDENARLGKQQFLSIKLQTIFSEAVLIKGNLSSIQFCQLRHVFSQKNIEKKFQILFDSNQPLKNVQIDQNLLKKNSAVLMSQLNYCRFLHYLIINKNCLHIKPDLIIKLEFVAHRHCLHIMNQLLDGANNWFRLHYFRLYVKTKKYAAIVFSIEQYRRRYEQMEEQFAKQIDIYLLRDFNKSFGYLFKDKMSKSDYEDLKTFLTGVLVQYKYALTKHLQNEKKQSAQTKGYIQGFFSLLKYRKLVQNSLLFFENYQQFEQRADIKIHQSYQNVKGSTKKEFLKVLDEIQYL